MQWEGPRTPPVPPHSGIGPPHYVRGAPGHATLQISPGAHPGPPAGGNPADGKPTVGWGGVWAEALTHSPKVLRRHPPRKVEPPPAPFLSGRLSPPAGSRSAASFAPTVDPGGARATSLVTPPGEGAGTGGASAPPRCSLRDLSPVGAPGLHPTPIRCSAGRPRSAQSGHLGRAAEHPATLWSGAPHLKHRPDRSAAFVHRCLKCPVLRHR